MNACGWVLECKVPLSHGRHKLKVDGAREGSLAQRLLCLGKSTRLVDDDSSVIGALRIAIYDESFPVGLSC